MMAGRGRPWLIVLVGTAVLGVAGAATFALGLWPDRLTSPWTVTRRVAVSVDRTPRRIVPATPPSPVTTPADPAPVVSTQPSSQADPIRTASLNAMVPERPPLVQAVATVERPKGVAILQIGDSHTAADFMTGRLRELLQDDFGNGGPGYVIAGKPHVGVRSGTLKIDMSPNWSYRAVQKGDHPSRFWMAGFDSVTSTPGAWMTFSSERPIDYDIIEIEAMRQPHAGSIDISIDGAVESRVSLDSAEIEPVVIRLEPMRQSPDRLSRVKLTTVGEGTVLISSVTIRNRQRGVTVSSVGFPGATIDVVNKIDPVLFAYGLRRLDPKIVILAFGTNEGFDDKLDLDGYAQRFRKAVARVRSALPRATIVIVGPADAARQPRHCTGSANANAPNCRTTNEPQAAPGTPPTSNEPCAAWQTPPNLAQVRRVQKSIADSEHLLFWDWSSIMPETCGAHRWVTAAQPLMAKDHVHFTREGYARAAEELARHLRRLIARDGTSPNVVSNN